MEGTKSLEFQNNQFKEGGGGSSQGNTQEQRNSQHNNTYSLQTGMVSSKMTLMSLLPSINIAARLFYDIMIYNPIGKVAFIFLMIFQEIVFMGLFTRLSSPKKEKFQQNNPTSQKITLGQQEEKFVSDRMIYVDGIGLKSQQGDTIMFVAIGIAGFGFLIMLAMVYQYFKIKKKQAKGDETATTTMIILYRFLGLFFGTFHKITGLAAQFFTCIAFYWSYLMTSSITTQDGNLPSTTHLIILIALSILQFELVLFSLIERYLLRVHFKNTTFYLTRASEGFTDLLSPIQTVIISYLCLRPTSLISQDDVSNIGYMLVIIAVATLRIAACQIVNGYIDRALQMAELFTQSISIAYYLTNLIVYGVRERSEGFSDTQIVLVCIVLSVSIMGIFISLRQQLDDRILIKMSAGAGASLTSLTGKINLESHRDQSSIEYGVYLLQDMMDNQSNPAQHMRFQKFMFENDTPVISNSIEEITYVEAMSKIMNEFRDSDDEDLDEFEIYSNNMQIDSQNFTSEKNSHKLKSLLNKKHSQMLDRFDTIRSDMPQNAKNGNLNQQIASRESNNPQIQGENKVDEYLGLVAQVVTSFNIKRRLSNALSNMTSLKQEIDQNNIHRMTSVRSRPGNISSPRMAAQNSLRQMFKGANNNDAASISRGDQDAMSIASKLSRKLPSQYGDRLHVAQSLRPEKPPYVASSPPSQFVGDPSQPPRTNTQMNIVEIDIPQFQSARIMGMNSNSATTNNLGYQGCEPEGINHLLVDIFVNNIQKKKQNENFAPGSAVLRQRDRLTTSTSSTFDKILQFLQVAQTNVLLNVQDLLKLVKVRFVYDQVARTKSSRYPRSLRLMFFKALFAIERLNNKYLTLTTITHINLYSKRNLSYIQQLRTKISELYFVETSIKTPSQNQSSSTLQNTSSTTIGSQDSMTRWTENDKEIDITQLLEQNLEVEKVRSKLRLCCEKIAQFWQLYNSPHLSRQQFTDFLRLTSAITDLLSQIRQQAKQVQNMDSFYSKSDQLCFALSQFYSTVLRDQRQGMKIAQRMESYMQGGMSGLLGIDFSPHKEKGLNRLSASSSHQNKLKFKENAIDDIGVVVVDGNFELYGKIIFGNKEILKMLGYQPENILDRTVHILMPRRIADLHNQFWRSFSQAGEPKVLDQIRFLYMRDSRGFVFPAKVFIKFQFTVQFGYSFVGLLKRPHSLLLAQEEDPLPLRDTYHILCDKKGGILEVSESVHELLRLSPKVVTQMHDMLQEGFLISMFSNELTLSEIDFSQNSCVYFKTIMLDFTKYYQHLLNIESNFDQPASLEEHKDYDETPSKSLQFKKNQYHYLSNSKFFYKRASTANFQNNPNQLFVQMKIIKETYGVGSVSEPLPVYYVIFTEATEEQIQQVINHNNNREGGGKRRFNGNAMGGDSLSGSGQSDNPSELFEDARKNTHLQNADPKPINGKANNPGDSEDIFKTGSFSLSSSVSSGTTNTDSAISALDDDLEDQRTPGLLMFLRAALKCLILLLIVMSLVQYTLNAQFKKQSSTDQGILVTSLQAQEQVSAIQWVTRAYLDVTGGLEKAVDEGYVGDRAYELKIIGLHLIATLRSSLQKLQSYLGASDTTNDRIPFFSLLGNSTVERRDLPRLYGVTLWLVQVEQIFLGQNVTSWIGTQFDQPKMSKVTVHDQLAFFALVNAQLPTGGLSTLFQTLSENQHTLLSEHISLSLTLNQLLSLLLSLLILMSLFSLLYLFLTILRLPHRVLAFFETLTKEQITLQEKSAEAFRRYLRNGNGQKLVARHQQYIQEFKSTMNLQQSKQNTQRLNSALSSAQDLQVSQEEHKEPLYSDQDDDFNDRKISSLNSNGDIQEKGDDDHHHHRKMKKVFESSPTHAHGKRQRQKKAHRKHKKSNKMSTNNMAKAVIMQHSQLNNTQNQHQPKQREVLRLLRARSKLTLMRTVPLLTILAAVLIMYFVTQYLLFERQQGEVRDNAGIMGEVIEGLECQVKFIGGIRGMQVQGNQRYKIDTEQRLQQLTRVQSLPLEQLPLNQTFRECLRVNQLVSDWLQNSMNGQFSLDGSNPEKTICFQYQDIGRLNDSQIISKTCEKIYKGVLGKTPLQATSIFLQDAFYSALKYFTLPASNQSGQLLTQDITQHTDAHILFLQPTLRQHYANLLKLLADPSAPTSNAPVALFAVFLSTLLVIGLVMHCMLSEKARRWFWNTFLLMQLLPRDDLDREFLKGINDFLRSA